MTVASRFLSSLPSFQTAATLHRRTSLLSSRLSLIDQAKQRGTPLPDWSAASAESRAREEFGEGLITNVVERSGDQDLSIEFIRHGKKIIQAGFANLDVIED
jgi:hypothetical protein